ncbi:MAG: hypothetical protein WHV28_01550 [Bacteroidota bacterium]
MNKIDNTQLIISYRLNFFSNLGYILLIFSCLFLINEKIIIADFSSYSILYLVIFLSLSLVMIIIGNKQRKIIFDDEKFIMNSSAKNNTYFYRDLDEAYLIKNPKNNNLTLRLLFVDQANVTFSSSYIGTDNINRIFEFLKEKNSNVHFDTIIDSGIRYE